MKWPPTTCISRVQVIKSTMTILRILERSESWPVATKKVRNSAVVGIRIFLETRSGLVERLIVETTVMFFDHLVSPFISEAKLESNKKYILNKMAGGSLQF
jgi:hypothetical protein